jgi:hypothetical protein
VNHRNMGKWVLLASVVLAAGCSAEKDCRDGLKQLKPRVEGAIGTGEHAEANLQISQAYTDMMEAEAKAGAGDFAGCVAEIEDARVLLNKSQRTNQQ